MVYECEEDLAKAYMMHKTLCRFFLHIVAEHNAFGQRIVAREKADWMRACGEALKKTEAMHARLMREYEQDYTQRERQAEEARQRQARLDQEQEDFAAAAALAKRLEKLASPSPPPPAAAAAAASASPSASATSSPSTAAAAGPATAAVSSPTVTGPSVEAAYSPYPSVHDSTPASYSVRPPTTATAPAPTPQQLLHQTHQWQAQQQARAPASAMPVPSAPPASSSTSTTIAAPTGPWAPFSTAVAPSSSIGVTPAEPARRVRVTPQISTTLRAIHLPTNVLADFYAFAQANTEANVETCAILCGRFDESTKDLWITHVLVPNQTATADTCVTTDEEQLIALQIEKDLLTLGWSAERRRGRAGGREKGRCGRVLITPWLSADRLSCSLLLFLVPSCPPTRTPAPAAPGSTRTLPSRASSRRSTCTRTSRTS